MAEPTGPEPAAGAVPPAPAVGAALATPGTPAPATPPAGFVPLAALQGEQANTTRAREDNATLRAHMELQGFRFGEDGIPVAPQPQAAPASYTDPLVNDPDVQAASQGIASTEQWVRAQQKIAQAALSSAAPSVMAPVGELLYSSARASLASIPEFRGSPEVLTQFDSAVKSIASEMRVEEWRVRGSKELLKIAEDRAVRATLPALLAKAEERGRNPGKVVGSFSEGASPGSGNTPAPLGYSAETIAKMKSMGFTDAEIARAGENREVSGRYVR